MKPRIPVSKPLLVVLLVIVAPVCVVTTFFATLAREIRSAFIWAWLAARDEVDSAVRSWREGGLR